MAVGSVSFGNTQAFQDLINKPQAYRKPEPSAATPVSGEKKSHKGVKIGVGIAAAIIAGAAALGIAAKTGKIDKLIELAGDKKVFSDAAKYAKTAGEWINNKAASITASAKDLITKISQKAPEAVETVAENATEVAQEVAEAVV